MEASIERLRCPSESSKGVNEVRTMFVHHNTTLFTSTIIVTIAVILSVFLSENLPF